jgi:hypothetical protein
LWFHLVVTILSLIVEFLITAVFLTNLALLI